MRNGTKVKVYLNLHKTRAMGRPIYSVLVKTPKGWRLGGHRSRVRLKDVSFVVSETGRQRVISEQAKNVHAFVCGTLDNSVIKGDVAVSYNPYLYGHFYARETGAPVKRAKKAFLGKRGASISGGWVS